MSEEELIRLAKLNKEELEHLVDLGILKTSEKSCQDYHIGKSDYSTHVIQPWNIWLEYNLNPWDADIVKRILRTKEETGKSKEEARIMDYEKIIHICKERIRQLSKETENPCFKQVSKTKSFILNNTEAALCNVFIEKHKRIHKGADITFSCLLGTDESRKIQCDKCGAKLNLA